MNEAVDEANYMVKEFKNLNYEVELLLNPDRTKMNDLFKNLMKTVEETKKTKERILIHFYYTGHGKMKDKTYIVLNESDPKKSLFPLETKMRTLSTS